MIKREKMINSRNYVIKNKKISKKKGKRIKKIKEKQNNNQNTL